MAARTPFTIRLKEARPDAVVVPVAMGIDDGAKEVGFSMVMKQKQGIIVVTKGVIRLRQDIREIMQERRNHRRQRRKRLGYRKARFDNRRREEGWIPPSIRAKKEAIVRVVRDFSARCIVERIVLEDAQIDTQKLKSPTIEGVQYQQGFTKDYCNLREAVLYRDKHTCQHCGERNKRLEVHHRHLRSEGGTNQAENLITLCVDCHEGVTAGRIKLKRKPVRELTGLKDAAHVMQGKTFLRRELGEIAPVESVFGYETKYYRMVQRLEKSHANDAVAMVAGEGKLAPNVTNDRHPELVVEPLRRRVRKLFDRHRRINRGVALVNVDRKRCRIKVVVRGEEVPLGTVKFIQHGDVVRAGKSNKTHQGVVCKIKSRGEIGIELLNGTTVHDFSINKMTLLQRPRNLQYQLNAIR